MKKNIIIGQSGGPTAVINGSLYGAAKKGLETSDTFEHVYGMVNGIEGFLNDGIIDMSRLLKNGELERLRTTPGAYLGSCRYKLPDDLLDPVYAEIFKKFKALNIGYFFYIGGNDSMDTVSKLSRYASISGSSLRVLGIPKTIDNDLIITDHTPGYGSAAKYVASTVREIVMDASVYGNKPAVTIIEIMGRHAGWLTAASALARKYDGDNPLLIYLPESDFDTDKFINKIQKMLETHSNIVVCISEGIHDSDGTFISEYGNIAAVDSFGHKALAGSGKYLENLIREKLDIKVRSVELNVCQRCSSVYISATDLEEAVQAGEYAVESALKGFTGLMITFIRKSNTPYTLDLGLSDVNTICNKEKGVPSSWIINDGSDISPEFITYARPLILGQAQIPSVDGLPDFAYRR